MINLKKSTLSVFMSGGSVQGKFQYTCISISIYVSFPQNTVQCTYMYEQILQRSSSVNTYPTAVLKINSTNNIWSWREVQW